MMKMASSVLAVLAILIGQVLSKRRYIDLTHPITKDIITFPGMPKYNFTNLVAEQRTGYWLEFNKFQLSEHAGTHMDSPGHFIRNAKYLDEIPLENLMGPGVIIDITDRAATDRLAAVQVSDLEKWEDKYGRIPNGAFVLMNSGWAKKYPNTTDIFGADVKTAEMKDFTMPGIAPAAAEWLVKNRDINGLGCDTPTPDQDGLPHVHLSILGANKILLENVANLHNAPVSGAMIYALPIRLHKGTGGPIRIFAAIDDGSDASNNSPQDVKHTLIGAMVSACITLLMSIHLEQYL